VTRATQATQATVYAGDWRLASSDGRKSLSPTDGGMPQVVFEDGGNY